MGYFSNGSEGDWYEAQYCARCVHEGTEERSCPIMELHALYNYDQCKKPSTAAALGLLIPRDATGGNGQCAMFWARGRSGPGGEPEPVPMRLTMVKAA